MTNEPAPNQARFVADRLFERIVRDPAAYGFAEGAVGTQEAAKHWYIISGGNSEDNICTCTGSSGNRRVCICATSFQRCGPRCHPAKATCGNAYGCHASAVEVLKQTYVQMKEKLNVGDC